MRKFLLTYAGILLGVYVLLTLVTHGDDYVVEREVWSINQEYVRLAANPDVVPETTFDQLVKKFQNLIDEYPDSPLRKRIFFRIGDIYALKGDYAQARKQFEIVISEYEGDEELIAQAKARMGKAYELADNWPEAYNIYQSIIRDHKGTAVGLRMPIYIARHYLQENNYSSAEMAFRDAVDYYRETADQNPDSKLGLEALGYLASSYLEQRKWQNAIDTFERLLKEYMLSEHLNVARFDAILKTVNVTAAFKMHDYDAATELYKELIEMYPDTPRSDYLKKMIDAFGELKEQGIRVSTEKNQ